MSSGDTWRVHTSFGAVLGPMSFDVVKTLIRKREVLPTDLVCSSSNATWKPLSEILKEFSEVIGSDTGVSENSESVADQQKPSVIPVLPRERDNPNSNLTLENHVVTPPKAETEVGDRSPVQLPVRRHEVTSARRPKRDTAILRPANWFRNTPHWPKVVVFAVSVLLVIWWFWPSPRGTVYPRLIAIWEEFQVRREKQNDQAGWDGFSIRANSELDELIPWLEEHAGPDDRELQLLLFVSRDCLRSLLKPPVTKGTTPEKRLLTLLRALEELRSGGASSQASADAIAAQGDRKSPKELDPENSASVLFVDPPDASNP